MFETNTDIDILSKKLLAKYLLKDVEDSSCVLMTEQDEQDAFELENYPDDVNSCNCGYGVEGLNDKNNEFYVNGTRLYDIYEVMNYILKNR